MTNLEYIIMVLSGDGPDDGGATFRSVVDHHIECPHYWGDDNLPCEYVDPCSELCIPCKLEWLGSEVDESIPL